MSKAQKSPLAQTAQPARPTAQDSALRAQQSALKRGARQRAWRTLRRGRLGLVGAAILLVIVLAAIFAPWIAPHDPFQGSLSASRRCPAFTTCPNLGGSFARTGPTTGTTEFLLGTDVNGRDILSRIIYAARISLLVGISAAALGGSLGVLAGLLSGYYGGTLDAVITRVADLQRAFPFI